MLGLPTNIGKARARLAILEQSVRRAALPAVEKRLVPAIVGKGGSNLRRLEETYGVSIEVPRDGGEMVVTGFAEKVAGAVAELEALLTTHADKEAQVPIDRFASRLLMADDGKLIKELRRATGCLLYMDMKKEAEHGFVGVRGPGFKLEEAVAAAKKALEEVAAATEVVNVGAAMVRFVIGKKGAVINGLREATGAAVEADTAAGRVRIYSPDPAVRAKARAELLAVLEKNQGSEVALRKDAAIALKGKSGQALRERAVKELEVQLDIHVDDDGDGSGSCVRLRGGAEAMATVRAELLAFAEENFGAEMVLLGDAYMTLVAGGDESLRKQVEKATGVTLIALKEEGLLKLRGPRTAVEAAEAAIRKALDGEDEADGTSAVVPCHPDAVPGLIGKGGAGVAKFREEHGCNLIVLQARDQIRVRGADPARVAGAAAALKRLLAEQRLTATVPAKDWQMEALDLAEFRRQYDVQVEARAREGFRVRGLVAEVGAAKQRLAELVTKRGKAAVELAAGQLARVPEGEWAQVREAYGVALDVDAPADRVLLQGGAEAVRKARAHVYGLLEAQFRGEYGHVAAGPAAATGALAALAQPQALAAFKARTGVEGVWLDREEGLVRVRGPVQAVAAAPAAVEAFLKEWAATRAEVPFDGAWMLPILVGKGGSKVKELEKAHGVTVAVDREGGVIRLAAPMPAGDGEEGAAAAAMGDLAAAKAALEATIATVQRENAEMRVPPEAIPALVGKGGQRIAKLREESGAQIDVAGGNNTVGGGGGKGGRPPRVEAVEGGSNVRLRGPPEAIDKAKEVIEAFVTEWLQSNVTQEVAVPHPEQFGLIVGRGGVTIKAIQEESGGARVELEREKGKAVVRGSASAVAAAAAAVQKLLDDDAAQNAARYAETAAAREAQQQREQERKAKGGKPQNGHGHGGDALQESGNSASSVISSTTGPPAPQAAGGAWNFPTVPPGADAALARQLLERQEAAAAKGKRRKKGGKQQGAKKEGEDGQGGEPAAAVVEPMPAAALAPAPAPAVERGSTPVQTKTKAPAADADGFVEVVGKGGNKAAGGGPKNGGGKPVAAAAAAAAEKKAQSALLDMVLGGGAVNGAATTAAAAPAAAPVKAASASAEQQEAKKANGSYFKSSTGFSIRL